MAKNGEKHGFFAFCLIENHQDIWEMGHGNKKCLFMIYKHFLCSQLKIFFKKFLAVKTKNVSISKTNIFCFHNPSPKCLGDFLLSKTQKIRVFCHFWPLLGRCENFLKQTFLAVKTKKCLYIKNKHFLFLWPISQMSWWFSIKQNAKKPCFLPFLATRWGRNHSKTPDSDSQRQITPI